MKLILFSIVIVSILTFFLKGKRMCFSIGFHWYNTFPTFWTAKGEDWACIWNSELAHEAMLTKRLKATGFLPVEKEVQ